MDRIWFTAALWLALALLATLMGTWLNVSVALAEIVVGVLAQLLLDAIGWSHAVGLQEPWVAFLAGAGSPPCSAGCWDRSPSAMCATPTVRSWWSNDE
jgi:glutathione-regulated potassium-efflux system ancillary protein KefC